MLFAVAVLFSTHSAFGQGEEIRLKPSLSGNVEKVSVKGVDQLTQARDVGYHKKVIDYIGEDGRHFEFVIYTNTAEVAVRVKFDGTKDGVGGQALKYLIHEVECLTTGKEIPLTRSTSFKYEGGYLNWGPYSTAESRDGTEQYKYLVFAEDVHVADGLISARGQTNAPPYNGYDLYRK